jgi:hypothetical protein
MQIPATIVQGHRVASGLNGNPHFPGGTLKMQTQAFRERGLDLTQFHPGTLNVSIAPYQYRVKKPKFTFSRVTWHPVDPAEDFSFFNVDVLYRDHPITSGLIYYPHPETKPTHFQPPNMLELLLPTIQGIEYGQEIILIVSDDQIQFDPPIA